MTTVYYSSNRPLYQYGTPVAYTLMYGFIFLYFTIMWTKSKYWWFNIMFTTGFLFKFGYFLISILVLEADATWTYSIVAYVFYYIAPVFVMSGVYYTVAKLVVAYGREFSALPPIWWILVFTTIDIIVLPLQGASIGVYASYAYENSYYVARGLEIAKAIIQLIEIIIFFILWFHFLSRVYFKTTINGPNRAHALSGNVFNFFRLLFNVSSVRNYKGNYMDRKFNSRYYNIRHKTLFAWFPLAITIVMFVVAVLSIFRIVEVSYNFDTRTRRLLNQLLVYVFGAAAMSVCGIVFVLFHPYWVFGKENQVSIIGGDRSNPENFRVNGLEEGSNEDNSKYVF
ncbi:Sphingoid long-chain base transporter RSB1 [Candida viswanathii]|uniref:Sphingoid long-chain base transporter RSB1 n=1 Tax=Candida viswanathii TaxID=5486 RepID=A0A367YP57_9ASCO|nr:Sphingoid long-chain base transporter RSB1 [Candida viswanathii]